MGKYQVHSSVNVYRSFGFPLARINGRFLGHKMLLRITLSLVYLWYKQRVKSAPTATAASSPESRVAEISAQITVLCQNCPVSVQTLLDMGFAIRNFKHSTIDHLQKHFEDKVGLKL